MRLLKRNLTKVEYLPYTGLTSDLNGDGEHTGEYVPVYGDSVEYEGNLSVPSGHVNPAYYGADVRYTHVLLLEDPKAAIDEYGVFRVKGELYEVCAVRPSLNVLSVALKKMPVSHAEPEEETEG